MCSPEAALGTQVAGATSGAVSAFYGAKAQKRALEFQAEMDQKNAALANESADQEIMKGNRAEQQVMMQGANVKSTARTAMAANGVQLGYGTAKQIEDSIESMTAQDAQMARVNAARAAFGQRMQAGNFMANATMARGTASGISPFMSGFSSLLGSAGSVSSNWYMMKKAGAFSGGGAA